MHLPRPAHLIGLALAACAGETRAPEPAGALPGSPPGSPSVWIERRVALMGTSLEVRVEAETRAAALEASELAVRALEAADARLSTWRDDTELARLNRTPVGERFELSEELAADLSEARIWWRESGGAFDPTVGALVEAWGLRTGGRLPSADELCSARVPGGFAALEQDGRSAVRTHAALRLEEGGFGKGAGVDAALAELRGAGVRSATLDLGGQVASIGPAEWRLADPRERSRAVLALALSGGSLATSGNSERAIVAGGIRRSHVLDPRTGEPAADFGSLSVWVEGLPRSATAADCLSTALYVMGPDAALAWTARRQAERPSGGLLEVLVLEAQPSDRPGGALRARATAGLFERARPLVSDLRLERYEPGAADR
jgi:thiamine biosynthesis lipoprotein